MLKVLRRQAHKDPHDVSFDAFPSGLDHGVAVVIATKLPADYLSDDSSNLCLGGFAQHLDADGLAASRSMAGDFFPENAVLVRRSETASHVLQKLSARLVNSLTLRHFNFVASTGSYFSILPYTLPVRGFGL